MALLKTKLKSDFKDRLKGNKGKGGGRKEDNRFLNYYDLKENQKMEILLLPDPSGELIYSYETHGPNMRLPGAGSVRCSYESSDESCPACGIGWEAYQKGDKEESAKWMRKETIVAQCVVLNSPIEIPDNPDDNLVKLIYLPSKVRDMINNAITEEIIGNPTEHVLHLKKTKNDGGMNSYESSWFTQAVYEPDQDLIDAVEEDLVRPYSFDELLEDGTIPSPTSADEVQEWVEKVQKIREGARSGSGDSQPRTRTSSRNNRHDENDGIDDDDDIPQTAKSSDDDSGSAPSSSKSTSESVRDKLDRIRNRKR